MDCPKWIDTGKKCYKGVQINNDIKIPYIFTIQKLGDPSAKKKWSEEQKIVYFNFPYIRSSYYNKRKKK